MYSQLDLRKPIKKKGLFKPSLFSLISLKALGQKEQINILCKSMPFIFQKVEAIQPTGRNNAIR